MPDPSTTGRDAPACPASLPDTPLRALSLGAGVQSTTLLLMSLSGEVEPFDVAVFADTQAEPREVYDHLAKLTDEAERHGLEVVTVTAGNLTAGLLDPSVKSGIQIPAFMERGGVRDGMLRRQCTEKFKSRPVYKWLNSWRQGHPVTLAMGISWDELQRMKPAKRRWITNEYPLIDRRMDRTACHHWMADAGWTAPRSACVYCPFHGDAEWRRLRDDHPNEFAEAVRVDVRMREVHAERSATGATSLTGTPYVHRQMVPLDQVDFRTVEERGQGSLFDTECEGFCGV